MTYTSSQRNWEGVEFGELRRVVDKKFNDAHDELSALYYDEWKNGNFAKAFRGYKPSNQAEARELFDKLHRLIFNLRDVALDKANEAQVSPDQKLRDKFHQIPEGETKKPIEKTKAQIAELKAQGIEPTV